VLEIMEVTTGKSLDVTSRDKPDYEQLARIELAAITGRILIASGGS
jgi:hypothetical protein